MLLPEEKVRLLSMVEILEPLSREEIEELSRRVPDRRVEQGRIFYTPEERNETLFMLKKGRVRLYKLAPDGRELTLAVVGAGAVFGEMTLTAQRLQGAYAEAMDPVVICAMKRVDLERLVLEKPEVGLRMMRGLSERLALYEARIEDIGLKDAPARLASIIRELAEREGVMTRTGVKIPTHYSHRQLATMIGSSRETMTRAFTRLQEAGAVESRFRRIYVKDPEMLGQVARHGLSSVSVP